MTESIRKLSNFNFRWTKTLYQNNLKNITFFFAFFNGYRCNQLSVIRGGSRIFFRRGCTRLLLYFNTNKPHSFFIFLQNTSCIRKPQVISGEGGGTPLHPPPRSAPVEQVKMNSNICMIDDITHNVTYPTHFKGLQGFIDSTQN